MASSIKKYNMIKMVFNWSQNQDIRFGDVLTIYCLQKATESIVVNVAWKR